MTDAPTLSRTSTDGADQGRTIRPRRSLPGGRAVIGAFLVVVAAVGTFGAYLSATAAPDTSYMVATRTFEIGQVIEEEDLVGGGAGFRSVPIDLPEQQAARAFSAQSADAEALLGQVVVAPIGAGDLLQRTHFADVTGAGDGVAMSFSLPMDRALAGQVGAGERVDVIATHTRAGADGSETRLVARDVTVISAMTGGDGLNGGRVVLTVELPDRETAQQVQHAVDTAQVAILRGGDGEAPTPAATTSDGAPRQENAASGSNQPDEQAPAPTPPSGAAVEDTPEEQG